MNRPLRKLLSFSAAAAVLCNVPLMHAGAAYVAEQVGDGDFDTLIRREGENILVGEGGDQSKLVVIGKDGTKRLTTLEESISAIYPEGSVGMDTYNFLSPTPAAYSFDFFDPAFRLSTEQAAMIAGTEDGKYALADLNGKLISAKYDIIVNMKNGYYEAVLTDGETYLVGVLGPDGKEVLKPSPDVNWVYLSKDAKFFLVCTPDGDYLTDLTGKKISKTYKSISGIVHKPSEYSSYNLNQGWSDSQSPVQEDWETKKKAFRWGSAAAAALDENVLRWQDETGKYALSFTKTEPETEYYARAEENQNWNGPIYETSFQYGIKLSDDQKDEIIYALDGSVVKPDTSVPAETAYKQSMYLYDYPEDGSEPVEYAYQQVITWEPGNGGSVLSIYDTEGKLLMKGQIAVGSSYLIQPESDGKKSLYNAKMELVGTYDRIDSGYDYFYAVIGTSGDQKDVYSRRLHLLDEETAQFAQGLKDAASNHVEILKNGYLLYSTYNDGVLLKLYDQDFHAVQEYTVPVPAGAAVSWSLDADYNGEISVSIKTTELDDDGNETKTTSYENLLFNEKSGRFLSLKAHPGAKKLGAYFQTSSKSGIQILDADGEVRLELPADFKEVKMFDAGGETFYTAQADGYFSVYGSDLTLLQEKIEGVVRDACIYSDTAEDESALYGFFNPSEGALTGAVYTKPQKTGYEPTDGWTREPDADSLFYVASETASGTVAVFDRNGRLIREFKGTYNASYSFKPVSGSGYTEYNNGGRIVLKSVDKSSGKENVTVYEPKTNQVILETKDRFDKVGAYQDGYMVVTQFPQEGEQILWTDSRAFAQGLINEEGRILIQPTRDLHIGLSKYCHKGATPGRYDQRDYAINSSYETANGEESDIDCYAVLNGYAGTPAVYVPMKDLDAEFAAANQYGIAVNTNEGSYAVEKDGKWGIADQKGKLLSELKYDAIYEFTDGIAWTVTYMEVEYESRWAKDENGNPLKLTGIQPCRGLIGKDGREIAAPRIDYMVQHSNYFSIERFGNEYRTRADIDPKKCRYRYRDYKGSDLFNDFTAKYGYDSAEQHGKLWIVEKDGKKGVVTDDNSVVIPVEFADVLSFSASAANNTRSPETLSGKAYTEPLVSLGNDTLLVTVRTDKDKVRAYIIKDDGTSAQPLGDVNGNQEIGVDDAQIILKAYTERIAGKDMKLTAEQIKAADVDGNGEISVEDAQLVLRYYTEKTVAGKDITWDDLLKKK